MPSDHVLRFPGCFSFALLISLWIEATYGTARGAAVRLAWRWRESMPYTGPHVTGAKRERKREEREKAERESKQRRRNGQQRVREEREREIAALPKRIECGKREKEKTGRAKRVCCRAGEEREREKREAGWKRCAKGGEELVGN